MKFKLRSIEQKEINLNPYLKFHRSSLLFYDDCQPIIYMHCFFSKIIYIHDVIFCLEFEYFKCRIGFTL